MYTNNDHLRTKVGTELARVYRHSMKSLYRVHLSSPFWLFSLHDIKFAVCAVVATYRRHTLLKAEIQSARGRNDLLLEAQKRAYTR